MRLSELIGSEVRDARDRQAGRVVDVRVAHEPAPAGEPARPYRIIGLVVAPRPQPKLGRPDERGPWLFRLLDRRADRRRRAIPWERVDDARSGIVRVRLTES
jgi:sporulation protein YlmC with PRC-barrel domain